MWTRSTLNMWVDTDSFNAFNGTRALHVAQGSLGKIFRPSNIKSGTIGRTEIVVSRYLISGSSSLANYTDKISNTWNPAELRLPPPAPPTPDAYTHNTKGARTAPVRVPLCFSNLDDLRR